MTEKVGLKDVESVWSLMTKTPECTEFYSKSHWNDKPDLHDLGKILGHITYDTLNRLLTKRITITTYNGYKYKLVVNYITEDLK